MALIVAVLGAESSGKTELASALAPALAEATRLDCDWIAEFLREWCVRERRTPRIDEQRAIADEQRYRIDAAASIRDIVVADTTPLMTAVYSDYVFGDRSLYDDALAWHRDRVALTFVTGLDVPWTADGIQRDGPQAREPVDRLVRDALAGAGQPFGTLYGGAARRLDAAQRAVARLLPAAAPALAAAKRWRPLCLECLDPDCEQRLHRFPR